MIKLKLAKAELNRVSLKVDLQGHDGAYIYRARRVAGPYEEVGVARRLVVEPSEVRRLLRASPKKPAQPKPRKT